MSNVVIPETSLQLIPFYRDNPIIAMQDLLGIDMPPAQQIVFEGMWGKKFVIVTAGRGCGKSFSLAVYAALRGLLYPGTRIGLIAPSFRQSKVVFEEVRKLWLASPIFREATSKRPTFQSDRCVLEYRTCGDTPHSIIEAVPLGTGEKIRGARFHVILADEFAQLPPEIFDAVIKPMAATSSDPMKRVKQLARIKQLKELGVSEDDLMAQLSSNTIIMSSSAYYKFNHMYRRIQEYEDIIARGDRSGYSVLHMNYLDMPEGFMNANVIEEAQSTMAASLFRMEYLGLWESDSDGVYKASLLQSRILVSGDTVRMKAVAEYDYIIACDPARTGDYFSSIVFEVQPGYTKVVYAEQHKGMKFPAMADRLMYLCEAFNASLLVMDSQGGGLALKDLLADETKYSSRIILDKKDPEYFGIDGNRILELINPSPAINAECVWSSLKLLESSQLYFAGAPLSGDDEEESIHETITVLVKQLLNIVVTTTKSGQAHFDVPVGGGHSAQKKDLFSAFIYGARGIVDFLRKDASDTNVLWDNGVIFSRDSSKADSSVGFDTLVSSSAVLTSKVNK